MEKQKEYLIDEHIHRYGVWTAARAASISRLKNAEVDELIRTCKLREAVDQLRKRKTLNSSYYRDWFESKGNEMVAIIGNSKSLSSFKKKQFKFGVAAKIISIYIKTTEVLPTAGKSTLSKIAYPPIDSILLKRISTNRNLKIRSSWSLFTNKKYFYVVDRILMLYKGKPNWIIEVDWSIGG